MLTGVSSIAGMIVIWLGASLALGRGWCSWICFYGGFDEGFSSIVKKPLLKNIDRRWTLAPYAVLLGIVVAAAVTLEPVYCSWICPFKAVSEFHVVDSPVRLVQTIIFLSLFIGLVIVLPILTKRRTQCSFLCPFAAFQPLANKINVFEVRIDTEKCVHCHQCVRACPTFSLDEESVKQGRTLLSCTKCGSCVDICPKKAVSFHVKGTGAGKSREAARLLFLYAAFLFGAVYGAETISDGLWRILKFITTGSFI
jgi:polyferredoxin